MSAQLRIRDGSPHWWMSPDIWVVPGSDPNGPPGPPVAGTPAYLWAHLANTGDVDASGVRVDFYWANPAMQIIVGAAVLIGSAYADVPAGGSQDVLCLVPWSPTIVNGGHECVLAVAHSPAQSTPLPDPLPAGYDFNPPAHDEIAQRNLSVLPAARLAPLSLTLTAHPRVDKNVVVAAEVGGELDERVLKQMGLHGFRPGRDDAVQVELTRTPTCPTDPKETQGSRRLEVHVPRGQSAGVFVTVRAACLQEREYHLIHVLERAGDRVLGGISYVAVHSWEGLKS